MSEKYAETWDYSRLKGWATIDYADSTGGYEWDQIHVLRGPDGNLYTGTGSGCSCNYFGDEDPVDFVRHMGWVDAARAVRAWIDDAESWRVNERETVGMSLIERLTTTKPAGHIEHDPRKGFTR